LKNIRWYKLYSNR